MEYPVIYPDYWDSPELRYALAAEQLPVDDHEDENHYFARFAGSGGDTVAFGGLEPRGHYVLLRSVVVLPAYRGKGFGRAVIEKLLELAWLVFGARQAFLFTTSAAGFFEHLGFTRIPRGDAPAEIVGTVQGTTICASADLLRRDLVAND